MVPAIGRIPSPLVLLATALAVAAFTSRTLAAQDAPQNGAPSSGAQTDTPVAQPQPSGIVTGTVVDSAEEIVPGATVKLSSAGTNAAETATTDEYGKYSFGNVAPGPFRIEVSAQGFNTQLLTGTLKSGDTFLVPPILLPLSTVVTRVVVVPQDVQAEIEIKQEEKQRLLGVVPNFYVTYLPNPAPLSANQKFHLAFKSMFDPITFGITGAVAGIEQGTGYLDGYGSGPAGYAKRYAATYGEIASGTLIGAAVLPAVFKQDPRYFYKGSGSKASRVLYALGFAIYCKGDDRRWQPNYSNILGNFAAAGITTLYYPAQDRHTSPAIFTVENALIGIGASAATNVIEEFISKKLTPKSDVSDGSTRKPFIMSRLATALIPQGQ